MEGLARMLAAMTAGGGGGGGPEARAAVLSHAPFAGRWTFIDLLRTVDCSGEGTQACCVDQKDSTSPILQSFPAEGRHTARFKVHEVNSCRPLGFGVMPLRAGYRGGNYYVGEVELTGSVGLVSHENSSQLMTKDSKTGDIAPAISEGAEVEVKVENGTFEVFVNGEKYGSSFHGLTGRLRFGVSLCGKGQKVEILDSHSSMAGVPAEGSRLLGRRVVIKDVATVKAVMEGAIARPSPSLLRTCGKDGYVEMYDEKDDTYKIRSDVVYWYTVGSFDVLPSHYPKVCKQLIGRSVRVRPEDGLIRFGLGLLGGMPVADVAGKTGILQSFDDITTDFTIRLEGGGEINAPRVAFDVAVGDRYTKFVPGDFVKMDDKKGIVLEADMNGPQWVTVRWSDGQEMCCEESELLPGEPLGDDNPPAASPDRDDGPTPDVEALLRALQGAQDPSEMILSALKRTLNGLGLDVNETPGRLILALLGVGISCRVMNGVVVFKAESVAMTDLNRAAEVSQVLNDLQRDKLLGRLDLDSDGDVGVTVAYLAEDTPLSEAHVRRALQVLGQGILDLRTKVGPFIRREPGQTFLYHSGVRYSTIKPFDISDEACHRFSPFSHGDRLRDPSDNQHCTVIGVKKDAEGQDRLWYHADGASGAGLYEPETEKRLVKVGHVTVEPACT